MRLPPVSSRTPSSALAVSLASLFVALTAWAVVAAPAPRRAATAPAARPAVAPLPDSVLARIDDREDITERRFKRAVRLLGGEPDSLTPETRDGFLRLVIEQRLLATAAASDPRPWPKVDSVNFRLERNRIVMQGALSHRLSELERHRRSLGQPDLNANAMGIAFRESLMVDLAPRFDDALLASLIPAWRALPYDHDSLEVMERIKRLRALPVIPAGDTDRVVVRSKDGALRVADVVRGWDRMPAMQRPRVERAEQLKAIIENQIVENRIRIESELPANLARPEVAGAIADRYEYHAVSGWLQHTIVDGIPTDSLTLLKHYRAHPDEFTEAAKARAIMLVLETRREADSLAARLRLPGEGARMQEQGRRDGVDFTVDLREDADTLLFRLVRQVGVHGVTGPDSTVTGWRILWVDSLTPPRLRSFRESHDDIERSWKGVEGERLVKERLDVLEQRAVIRRNEAALRRLVLSASSPAR